MYLIKIKYENDTKDRDYVFLLEKSIYALDVTKPLIYTQGVNQYGQSIINRLFITDISKVQSLPEVVTSRIVLLDNYNNVSLQTLVINKTQKDNKTISSKASPAVEKEILLTKNKLERQREQEVELKHQKIIQNHINKSKRKWYNEAQKTVKSFTKCLRG